MLFGTIGRALAEFIASPHANCQGCSSPLGADDNWLCTSCASTLQPLYARNGSGFEICSFCGAEYTGPCCDECKKRAVPTFRVYAAYEYTGIIKSLVHAFKFNGAWRMGEWMACEMKRAIDSAGIRQFDVITYVPLHYTRWAQRGYNQSKCIARQLARMYKKPCKPLLKRIRPTTQQSKLSAEKRRKNLNGAFAIENSPQDLKILLIDDVITTGTTLSACARLLKENGANIVSAAVFAKAVTKRAQTKKYHPHSSAPQQTVDDIFDF